MDKGSKDVLEIDCGTQGTRGLAGMLLTKFMPEAAVQQRICGSKFMLMFSDYLWCGRKPGKLLL